MTTPPVARPEPKPTPETAALLGRARPWASSGCSAAARVRPAVLPAAAVLSPLCERRRGGRSGRRVAARSYSYVINHRAAPGFTAPYVIAVVELDEGPRLLTNLVDVDPDPDALPLDLPVEVVFEPVGDTALPVFRPSAS